MRSFLAELRRRKVYRVTAIYLVLAVGGLELASVLLPTTRLPEWFDELFLGFAIVGLPLVLVLAWTFDVKEGAIERTADAPLSSGASRRSSRSAGEPSAPKLGAVEPSSPLRPPAAAEGMLDPLAIAVLPFENLSGAESAEPFTVGLHDDLLTELSRASALTVISRTSVKAYRGSSKPVREIARELGAGTIVEGGVQQAGNRVRLNIQLVDSRTEGHLWAERYDRELTTENIFDLQTELAGRIMAELHTQLTAEEAAVEKVPPTEDLEAYRLFATGRQAVTDRSEGGFRAGADLFRRAVGRDPGYALAWAALGDALVGLVAYGHTDAEEVLERGAEACERALSLDPTLAEAHAAWGRLCSHLRDAPGALEAHARAIELRPSFAGAHQWSCWSNLLLGNGRAAVPFGVKATRLDPFDPEAAGNLAFSYLTVGDPEKALTEVRRILVRHPTFQWGRWVEGVALQALGRWQEGKDVMGRLHDRWTRGWVEVASALDGTARGEEDAIRDALRRAESEAVHFKAGLIHALLGDVDAALEEMRRDWPLPWDETLYVYLQGGRPLDALSGDPRFEALVHDVLESWRTGER